MKCIFCEGRKTILAMYEERDSGFEFRCMKCKKSLASHEINYLGVNPYRCKVWCDFCFQKILVWLDVTKKKDRKSRKKLLNNSNNKISHNLCKCGRIKFAHSKRCQFCYFPSLRKDKEFNQKKTSGVKKNE